MKGCEAVLNRVGMIHKYTREEKEKLKHLIKVIINLSIKSNRQGLLSLEDDVPTLQPFLLRKGIELLTEGFSQKDLCFIVDNYIQAGSYSEPQLLERLIIKESLLSIQAGEYGEILFEKLLSMLGGGFLEDYDYRIFDEEAFSDKEPVYYTSISEICPIFNERIMKVAAFEDMEKLIMKVGYEDMAFALKGSSAEVTNHVKSLVRSSYILKELEDTIGKIKACRLEDIIEKQEKILSSIEEMSL